MDPRISVVIPCFNHTQQLRLSLASLARQSHQPYEVIIIDDGSQTPLATVESQIRSLLGTIPVTLFRQENKGAPAARNTGLSLARGEYLIFWDADVVGEPQMLEEMYTVLTRTSASFVYSNFFLAQSWGRKKMRAAPFDREHLRQNNYIHSTSLIRREAAPFWDESLTRFQDWDYWLTLEERGETGEWIDTYLFTVLSGGGMSRWLPRFAYQKPWRSFPRVCSLVISYEEKRRVVQEKHGLRPS